MKNRCHHDRGGLEVNDKERNSLVEVPAGSRNCSDPRTTGSNSGKSDGADGTDDGSSPSPPRWGGKAIRPGLLRWAWLVGMLVLAAVFYTRWVDRQLSMNGTANIPKSEPPTEESAKALTRTPIPFTSLTRVLFDVFAPSSLQVLSDKSTKGKDLVVTFVDSKYLDTLSVWLQYYKRHNHSNRILCVFAISKEAYDQLRHVLTTNQHNILQDNLGLFILTLLEHPGPGSLWLTRVKLLKRIVDAFPTNNVLYSDVDALWSSDPETIYRHHQHQNSTIVASRGTFPANCPLAFEQNKKGIAICFGFTYFRNSPEFRQFTADLVRATRHYGNDDQRGINCLLHKTYRTTQNSHSPDKHMSDSNPLVQTYAHPNKTEIEMAPIIVTVLPYDDVIRQCDNSTYLKKKQLSKATVLHCLTKKTGTAKILSFQKYGIFPKDTVMYNWAVPKAESLSKQQQQQLVPAESDKEKAYELALRRFRLRRLASSDIGEAPDDLKEFYSNSNGGTRQLVNSIRIPKAGSSSLSITARALAGCHPDGFPCCKGVGDPPGSCPRRDLLCPAVTGCTGHRPAYSGTEPIISSLRHPVDRLISAFFYTPPHRPNTHPGNPETYSWRTFQEEYIQLPKYRNVLTKMLAGSYAYANFDPNHHTAEKAKKRLCSIVWFVLVDRPILSNLMLYESSPFRQLRPNPVIFGLPALNVNHTTTTTKSKVAGDDGLRKNSNPEYVQFKENLFVEKNGTALVIEFNKEDMEVYNFAVDLFCARVREADGLLNTVVGIFGDGKFECPKKSPPPNGSSLVADYCPY